MQRQQNPGRARAGLFLVGSVLLALVASGLVFRIIKSKQDQLTEATRPKETLDVVVASRDLLVGLPISEQDVVVVPMVPGSVPEETTFSKLEDVIGRTPRDAPEVDGLALVKGTYPMGSMVRVRVDGALPYDLLCTPVEALARP